MKKKDKKNKLTIKEKSKKKEKKRGQAMFGYIDNFNFKEMEAMKY